MPFPRRSGRKRFYTKQARRAYARRVLRKSKARKPSTRRRSKTTQKSYYKSSSTVYPYRKSFKNYRRPPVIRGTSHRLEFEGTANSSGVSSNNPIRLVVNALHLNDFFHQGFSTSVQFTDHDAYKLAFPTGMRKLFLKGVKVNLRVTNISEDNVTIRICVAQNKYNMTNVDWNTTPNRVVNSRHYKVFLTHKFTMDQSEFVSTTTGPSPQGTKMVTKTFWIPLNEWRYARDGMPATAAQEWEHSHHRERIYMFIDTDDLTSAENQYVQFTVNSASYFYTVMDNHT